MNRIVLHDAFQPLGCAASQPPQAAVTVQAGARWIEVYDAVTTRAGRYVQGGGCATVGVAGLVLSGGFGSFSKRYGMAAAALLEAEIVTADGVARIANPCTHPDLFWAIKGGGGGSLGVVTRLTLRTRELPALFGGAFATVKAASDAAFLRLIGRFLDFYETSLLNPHWGESVTFRPDNSLVIAMVSQRLDQEQAEAVWRSFFESLKGSPQDFSTVSGPRIGSIPARHWWDADYLRQHLPEIVHSDDRPGAALTNVWWAGNQAEVGIFWHGYQSVWLPVGLLQSGQREVSPKRCSEPTATGLSPCTSTRVWPAPPRKRLRQQKIRPPTRPW